jgi:hypothetical protein
MHAKLPDRDLKLTLLVGFYEMARFCSFSGGVFTLHSNIRRARDSISLGARFLHLPSDLYFGEVTGVAVNSKGHIFVFSRGDTTGPAYGAAAAQLLEFGSDGRFLREIGHNLYAWSYAHTVKIDPQDNI